VHDKDRQDYCSDHLEAESSVCGDDDGGYRFDLEVVDAGAERIEELTSEKG
jgi:hypothetical protein